MNSAAERGGIEVRASEPAKLSWRADGRGRQIVLLHPVGLSGRFWVDVVERLAVEFRCISIDLRGHGSSAWDGTPFGMDDLAGDVVACLEELGGRSSLLVGCSMGGMVAQGVALRAPHLVQALVLSNSTAAIPPPARDALRARGRLALEDRELGAQDCIRRWFTDRFQTEQPVRVSIVREALLATDPQVIAQSWNAIADLDYEKRLSTFEGPALLVTGEFDTSVSPVSCESHAAAFKRATAVVIPDAGHLTPCEAPDAFAALVQQMAAKIEEPWQ